jgi:hypothetical protein
VNDAARERMIYTDIASKSLVNDVARERTIYTDIASKSLVNDVARERTIRTLALYDPARGWSL